MATFEIKMPKLGESITEGTIISWSVKVGDTVEEDDVLFEVSTAKVSAEIPSPVEGKVKQLLFNEGDTVAVGTVVALRSKVKERITEFSRKPRRLLNRKNKSPLPSQRNYQRIPKRKIVGILPSYCN